MRQNKHDEREQEFDHQEKKAALSHLIIQGKKKIAGIQQRLRDATTEILVLVCDFHKLSDIHGLWHDGIEGLETQTFKVRTQIASAAFYRWGMYAAIVAAVIFGVYFSTTSIIADSFWILLSVTTVAAVVLGWLASVVLRDFLHANPVNPAAAMKIRTSLVIFGAAFFLQLAFFAWIRFQSDSPYAAYLPGIMVGLEFSAVFCAATCHVGSLFYNWSSELHDQHRASVSLRYELQDELRHETETLDHLEDRLIEHEAHVAAHHDHHPEFDAAGQPHAETSTPHVHNHANGHNVKDFHEEVNHEHHEHHHNHTPSHA